MVAVHFNCRGIFHIENLELPFFDGEMRKLIVATMSFVFAGTPPLVLAVQTFTLAPVTVTGHYTEGYGFGSPGVYFYRSVGGAANPLYPQMVGLINQRSKLQSVRCSTTGSLRDVTSFSDADTRWLAAEAVFRAVIQTYSIWQRIFGQSPFPDGVMAVTYADGGTEKYLITNYFFSSAFPQGAQPDSLVLGDGVAKADPLCG